MSLRRGARKRVLLHHKHHARKANRKLLKHKLHLKKVQRHHPIHKARRARVIAQLKHLGKHGHGARHHRGHVRIPGHPNHPGAGKPHKHRWRIATEHFRYAQIRVR